MIPFKRHRLEIKPRSRGWHWKTTVLLTFFCQVLYTQFSTSAQYLTHSPGQNLNIGTVGPEYLVLEHDLNPNQNMYDSSGFEGTDSSAITSSVMYTGDPSNLFQSGNLPDTNLKWYQTDTGISLLVSGGFFTMAALHRSGLSWYAPPGRSGPGQYPWWWSFEAICDGFLRQTHRMHRWLHRGYIV